MLTRIDYRVLILAALMTLPPDAFARGRGGGGRGGGFRGGRGSTWGLASATFNRSRTRSRASEVARPQPPRQRTSLRPRPIW